MSQAYGQAMAQEFGHESAWETGAFEHGEYEDEDYAQYGEYESAYGVGEIGHESAYESGEHGFGETGYELAQERNGLYEDEYEEESAFSHEMGHEFGREAGFGQEYESHLESAQELAMELAQELAHEVGSSPAHEFAPRRYAAVEGETAFLEYEDEDEWEGAFEDESEGFIK
ncbi:MAG: hypothetical protein WCP07_09980, partial [bacterium]